MSETAMSETAVPAVPAMIHRILFRPVTTIAPGERIDPAEIDVGGAQHVTVNLGIKGAGANVEIVIVYIHRVTGGVAPVAVHNETLNPSTAEDFGHVNVFLPVYAPILQVILENTGREPAKTLHSWVYGVRFAAPS
jgi:hypothetical protein